MKWLGCLLGFGATSTLIAGLIIIVVFAGGAPFNPGPLSAEHPQNRPTVEFVSHADFENRCDLCHTPFHGPDGELCMNCHVDVRGQITQGQGLHGQLTDPQSCTACHVDHQGRTASMTIKSVANFPHNQFGFTLFDHQVDYTKSPMECRACHSFAQSDKTAEKIAILTACVSCHANHDAQFMPKHRREVGDACLACHDGTNRLKGFQHAAVYALTGKHTQVACVKCHANERYRGTPKDCVVCHADPQVHRGQFGTKCGSCHTTTAWTPARLIKHPFPLNHGNKGKESDCKVCHAANYATYTCYGCHDHTPENMAREHRQVSAGELLKCANCHPTGKEKE